ncbi:MAG: NupC/NupG family nucleoside CNT transporter [Elusimicrobia bacterium]|nr:NupC/NupG family nucleoside CNT transporter [Elusimicrobiota bacterium]
MNQLVSAFGIFVMIGIAWIFSKNRKAINWRTIGWATALQVMFAVLVLKTTPGRWFFSGANQAASGLIGFQEEGAKFVFGSLAVPPGDPGSLGFFFAFQVLTSIVFLAALISILYYFGILQKIVLFFGKIMVKTCGTSGAETLNAVAVPFLGQTEAPILIKPYIEAMTESELLCLMVAGMATIASGVMVVYAAMLKPYFPDSAGQILAAMVMEAPAALLMTKMLIPETGKPKTLGTVKLEYHEQATNVFEAAANGATTGLHLAFNVAAMLIAFMSLLAMVNGGFHVVFGWFGHPTVGLETILGWALSPLAWVMGVPWKDCTIIGQLIGEKTVLNEFVAYVHMSQWAAAHAAAPMDRRSFMIGIHALCGFANFLSIAIQIGGLGVLAPSRKADVARLGFYALLGGSLASFMTGCIAGMLVP